MDAFQIIRALGGPTALSRKIGASRSAISNWPRDGIPPKHWLAIARVAQSSEQTRHITLDLIEATRKIGPADFYELPAQAAQTEAA